MKVSKQQVTLVDYMGDDLSVVNAARVSFDKQSDYVSNDFDSYNYQELKEADKKLIKYLAVHNHWSPFSHASMSFRIKCPIFVARQLGKHQVGLSWNEVSRRYVDSEPEVYFPEYWRKKADNVKQGSSEEAIFNSPYWTTEVTAQTRMAVMLYEDMLNDGICAEQARMVLPQNMMTEYIWTGSLYAFARVCNLRLDSHTQRETQEIAQMISKEAFQRFPASWEVLVKDGNTNG